MHAKLNRFNHVPHGLVFCTSSISEVLTHIDMAIQFGEDADVKMRDEPEPEDADDDDGDNGA